jgi:hypothetical protein
MRSATICCLRGRFQCDFFWPRASRMQRAITVEHLQSDRRRASTDSSPVDEPNYGNDFVCDRRVIQAEVFEVRHSAEVRQTRIRHRRVSKVEFSEVRQSVQMSQADVRHFRASKGKLFKVCESSQVNQTGIPPHRVIEPEFSEIR